MCLLRASICCHLEGGSTREAAHTVAESLVGRRSTRKRTVAHSIWRVSPKSNSTISERRGWAKNVPYFGVGVIKRGAPIYHIWVILSNHHASQTARLSFSGFIQLRLPNHQLRLASPNYIANANPDPPTPTSRVVLIYDWRTKKDQKEDKRGGALSNSFSGFSSIAVLG